MFFEELMGALKILLKSIGGTAKMYVEGSPALVGIF